MKTGLIAGLAASLLVSASFADDVVEHERMIQKSDEFQKRFEGASPEQQKQMLERRNERLKMTKEKRVQMHGGQGSQGSDFKKQNGHRQS
jgi:uncharacterized membrane protein (DUF106 family)